MINTNTLDIEHVIWFVTYKRINTKKVNIQTHKGHLFHGSSVSIICIVVSLHYGVLFTCYAFWNNAHGLFL
jgi:hypothetical protein